MHAEPDYENRNGQEEFARPSWETEGHSGQVTKFLAKLVGADDQLLKTAPTDERAQIRNVGLALVMGVLFQFTCIGTGLFVVFRPADAIGCATILAVTAIVSGVLLAFDRAMVASHFRSQGDAYCAKAGLSVAHTSRMAKTAAVLARFGVSLAVAATFAVPVLLTIFGPEIDDELIQQSRLANVLLVADIARRAEEELDANRKAAVRAATTLSALEKEWNSFRAMLQDIPNDPALAELSAQLDKHRKRYDDAVAEADAHRADADAELHGQKVKPGHTGKTGAGEAYQYHLDRAKEATKVADRELVKVKTLEAAISEGRSTDKRRRDSRREENRTRVKELETQMTTFRKELVQLEQDKAALENGRNRWIEVQVLASPEYVAPAKGLIERMKALGRLITDDALLGSFVFAAKVVIMALEAAGPFAAWLYLPPGIYAMRVALRVRDETDYELDRRRAWARQRATRDARNSNELHRHRTRREAEDQVFEEFQREFRRRAANE